MQINPQTAKPTSNNHHTIVAPQIVETIQTFEQDPTEPFGMDTDQKNEKIQITEQTDDDEHSEIIQESTTDDQLMEEEANTTVLEPTIEHGM